MGEQQFCLKWNNYASSVTSVFKELLAEEQMCDVILSTEDKTIQAHRLILSACSAFFKNVFKNLQPWQQSVVYIKDITYTELKGIIEFIYNGEVSIEQQSLSSFLLAADSLKIKGLTEDSRCQKGSSLLEDEAQRVFASQSNSRNSCDDKTAVGAPSGEGSAASHATHEDREALALLNASGSSSENAIKQHSLETGSSKPGEPVDQDEEEEEVEVPEEEAIKDCEFPFLGNFQQLLQLQQESLQLQAMMPKDVKDEQADLRLDESLALADPTGAGVGLLGAKKTCPYCLQQLSWHALSRHIRDMHKAKTDLVKCQYCLKTFRNKNSLGCHIWRFHKRGREPKSVNLFS